MTFAITYYSPSKPVPDRFRVIEIESMYDARSVLEDEARKHVEDDERIHNIVRVK